MDEYRITGAPFRQYHELTEEEENEFKGLTYPERLRFFSDKQLEPLYYIARERQPPHEIVGAIVTDNPEERALFYRFFIPYYRKKFPVLCDLENLKADLYARLSRAPDKQEFIRVEYERREEKSRIARGVGQTYYEIGYKTTFEGRDLDFSNLDDFRSYFRLLEGEVTCKFLACLRNFPMDDIQPVNLKLQWKGHGSKGELSELIYALCQTRRITYKDTGDPVTQKDLKEVFEKIFNTSISDINNNLRPRVNTYNRTNKTKDLFCDELLNKIKEFREG